MKKHYEQYEPTLTELRHKYEVAMKELLLTLQHVLSQRTDIQDACQGCRQVFFPMRQEKMLMRLERDRYAAKVRSLVTLAIRNTTSD